MWLTQRSALGWTDFVSASCVSKCVLIKHHRWMCECCLNVSESATLFFEEWLTRRRCGIIQIPRPPRFHLAKPVNTAGSRSQLGRAGAASSYRCEMRPLVVSDPLQNIAALQLWTHTSTEEQKDCKFETQQGQL